jgi:hypothetical protein
VVGKVVRDSANLLTLDTGAGTRTGVLTSTVDSLWVPHGGYAGTGAVIGAAAGGAALGAFAVAFGHDNCYGPGRCGSDAGNAVSGLLIGGAIGARIGALIGSMFPKWQLRAP